MKRNLLAAVVASVALTLSLAAPLAASGPEVPFRGSVAGPDTYLPPVGCPADASWLHTGVAEGEMLHLGRVHLVNSHCTWDDLATLSGHFGPGTMTITAANGDQLVLTEQGTYTIDLAALAAYPVGSWVVVDGSGRFAGATGSGTFAGVSDFISGISTLRFAGSISY